MLKLIKKHFSFLSTTLIVFVIFSVVFLFINPLLAQVDYGVDYAAGVGLGSEDIRVAIVKVLRVVLGVLGILALLIVLYGGFVWMTAGGNPQKVEKAN